MERCPACGTEVPDDRTDCESCHLAVALFGAVREAAGPADDASPTYLRTIGELLASVDLEPPSTAAPAAPSTPAVRLGQPPRFPALPSAGLPTPSGPRTPAAVRPLRDLPALPPRAPPEATRHRLDDYFQLGRRLGLDFSDFDARWKAAEVAGDATSREVLEREMFVHLASALAEEYEAALARRNELAPLVPTSSADVELVAVHDALGSGDLGGAQRRLAHVRDEINRIEDEVQVARILVTECELLTTTLRELGGDPAPALGPLDAGRRLVAAGRREEGERVLAGAAVAMWSLVEPRLVDDLKRLRDLLVARRTAGREVGPAVADLRALATELRQRNFVGTILAYRRVREFVAPVLEGSAPAVAGEPARAGPSP